jgi:Mn-dependent DtxR family transcriptional regulator
MKSRIVWCEKDHGVSASYIKRMKERGYGDLTLDEYIRLRDRGERE